MESSKNLEGRRLRIVRKGREEKRNTMHMPCSQCSPLNLETGTYEIEIQQKVENFLEFCYYNDFPTGNPFILM